MIIFDVSKRETHHPNANFKKLCKRLRVFAKVQVNKEDLSADRLQRCDLLVIGSPQTRFIDDELQALKDFIDGGGAVAVFSCEGGDRASNSNLNQLLVEYGISIDSSSVVRSVYHKYLHPKHALISNGVVQPEIGLEKYTPLIISNGNSLKGDRSSTGSRLQQRKKAQDSVENSASLSFVYPNGTTINVENPAYTLLSSGSTSYPLDCPIAAAWEGNNRGKGSRGGRLLVLGSCEIFADFWLEKEENSELCDIFFRFLLRQNISFDPSKGRSDFEEKECVPDISSLANLIKACLQDSEQLPQDYKSLLCENLFRLHNDYVPDVRELYSKLNITHEPLTLVEPHFECPHPPLRLASHLPIMMDPPLPSLELFDLDECFSDVQTQISQLTNRFKEDSDLNDYIEEAGCILGIDDKGNMSMEGNIAKHILCHVGEKLFQCKMENDANFSGPDIFQL